MPSYTIQSVEQAASGGEGEKTWTRQKLAVLEAGGVTPQNVTLFCNKWQPVPAVGSTIEGDIQPPKQDGWTPELKPPRKSGGGGGKDFKADPAKQAAIAVESAQKVAIDVLRLAMEQGVWKAPDDRPVAEMTGVVKTIAQSLYAQITEASEAAK